MTDSSSRKSANEAQNVSRRLALTSGIAAGIACTGILPNDADALARPSDIVRLRLVGAERSLPNKWLGYNSPAPFNIPIEDPALVPAIEALHPQWLRFPGGTVANYYQWRTGQLLAGNQVTGSPLYTKFSNRSRLLHPNGVFIKQYVELCREIDADLIVVPNLESSSVEEQAAWFAQMNRDGFVPSTVEMGNEFYLALLMNPDTLRKFPDWQSTIALTKRYTDAIRPYLAKDARIAVQAAGTKFHNPTGHGTNPFPLDDAVGRQLAERELKWDSDMRPEPWFQAVTTHLYPTIEGSAGFGALSRISSDFDQIFSAFMARVDEGFDRTLSDTVARMPDKEIWITEWGPGESRAMQRGIAVTFDGMWFHMIVRSLLAMLRHPQVTLATQHSLFCDGNFMSALRRVDGPTGHAYVPVNASGLLTWFADASRGPDAHYQYIQVDGAKRIIANGTVAGEAYRDVDACMFRKGRLRTIFVQNATATTKRVDLSTVMDGSQTFDIQIVATPDMLASLMQAAPTPTSLPAATKIDVPPYSVTRVAWQS